MSAITTHILDTTKGKPAQGVAVNLFQQRNKEWSEIAGGITNKDGRISDLLGDNVLLEPGIYKLKFETKKYFDLLSIQTLYPFIEIAFSLSSGEHYHIPLLLNPFGYSTYRGS